jgi:hypothetical protein
MQEAGSASAKYGLKKESQGRYVGGFPLRGGFVQLLDQLAARRPRCVEDDIQALCTVTRWNALNPRM